VGQGERFFVHLPFSVYLGWITVATIANIGAYLVKINWDDFGLSTEFWTALMIGITSAITLTMLILRKDLFFSLVILWAFFGILYKRLTVDPQQSLAIWITTVTGIFLITSLVIFLLVKPFIKVKE
jgi:DMSO/TMAO reductase YedYZ heme-binding membrane subunit